MNFKKQEGGEMKEDNVIQEIMVMLFLLICLLTILPIFILLLEHFWSGKESVLTELLSKIK